MRKQVDSGRTRVLILDDDPHVRMLLSEYLCLPGIDLMICRDREGAECLLGQYPFHMVITDLEVSELGGLEGMNLVRYLSAHFPETRTVIFSGYVDEETVQLGRSLGAAATIQKGSGLKELRSLLLSTRPESTEPGRTVELASLEDVLRSRSITSMFQPIVELFPGTVYGCEALSRGPRDSLLQNPELLFEYAARREKLLELDLLCLDTALRSARDIPNEWRMFLNVQPRSLTHSGFVDELRSRVVAHGRTPGRCVVEITEQQRIVNAAALRSTIDALRQEGFRLALDDFGEGIANLDLLYELRPDVVKISGKFCSDIGRDRAKQEIVRSIAGLSRNLGIRTLIEKVEQPEEARVLPEYGVELGQGYHFGRPVAPEQLLHPEKNAQEVHRA